MFSLPANIQPNFVFWSVGWDAVPLICLMHIRSKNTSAPIRMSICEDMLKLGSASRMLAGMSNPEVHSEGGQLIRYPFSYDAIDACGKGIEFGLQFDLYCFVGTCYLAAYSRYGDL